MTFGVLEDEHDGMNMCEKRVWIIFLFIVVFCVGGITGTLLCRKHYLKAMLLANLNSNPNYNPDNMPDSIGIKIDSTNLPIVFINTDGEQVERNEYITARMKIIDNFDGENYGDTLAHPHQEVDFEGYVALKYRGMSSYGCSPKKSYAIRALDKPLSDGGKKKKSKLLSMRKGKKWALKAVHIDKSMIRDALSFELARPWMEFVPQQRFCEVIIDGIYRGIYALSEQITADRLKIEKPGESGDALTGGYLLQIDRREKEGAYLSKYWDVGYRYEYPDSEKISSSQREYVNHLIDEIESSMLVKPELKFADYIDIYSMIDCQLVVEFSCNTDSYNQSTFFYKTVDSNDSRIKFCVWDFDLAYGNGSKTNFIKPNIWVYNSYDSRRFWWTEAMENVEYSEMVRQRWRQYRQTNFSNEHIEQIIDSLTNVLTVGGAERRNSDAWIIWHGTDWRGPNKICAEKYLSTSYDEEIEFVKEWIKRRLYFMDGELLVK